MHKHFSGKRLGAILVVLLFSGLTKSVLLAAPTPTELQTHDANTIGYMATVPSGCFRLWPGAAPGALGHRPEDIPTLTPLLPDPVTANGSAMVICPGGAYKLLGGDQKDLATFLTHQGVTCFVLRYRLGTSGYRHPIMLQDVSRAFRTVRARAAEWNLDPNRIGIMGISAGGHLASTLLTHFDTANPTLPTLLSVRAAGPVWVSFAYRWSQCWIPFMGTDVA